MPRINVEEKFWFDPRLDALSRKLGSEALAIGYVLQFWRLAQEQFKSGKLVTENQFKLAGLPDTLFDCEFAIRTEHGIRCKGDKRNFSWLVERKEAGRLGGVASAKSRSSKINDLTEANASKLKQTQPSTSTSTSTSFSKKDLKKELPKGASSTAPTDVSTFIVAFIKVFQNRYGVKTRPDLGPKVQGQIKSFVKGRPITESVALIQVYLQMNDPWFVKKCHDFSTFLANVQKVKLSFDTGQEQGGEKRSRPISEILSDEQAQRSLIP